MVFGTVLAIMTQSTNKFLKAVSSVYIVVVRNIPNLLWIYVVFLLFKLKSDTTGIVSFTLFSSAAIAEIVRGGLNSVDEGQVEAARSQGLDYFQSLFYVILPQAFAKCLPTLSAQVVTIVKDTSLLWSVAAIQELTGNVTILMNKYHDVAQIFILYGVLMVVYFIINSAISNAFKYLNYKCNKQQM
jgi:putative glutamine transport system permease protein